VAAILPLLVAATASARIGGLAPGHVRPSAAASRGYFDGKSYELGFHLTPLFGYESNYTVTSQEVSGSGLFALEGGAELRYRPTDRLRLRAELEAMLRLPFADTALTEFVVELPLLLHYRLVPRLDLFLSNHAGAERAKTPPIFLDTSPKSLSSTIRYYGYHDQLRAGLTWRLGDIGTADIGPYFRVRQVNFIEPPAGNDPDYRLYDAGVDVAGKLYYRDRFSARLKYDYAHRFFRNYMALPPTHQPPLMGTLLAMDRHLVGLLLRARVVGPFGLFAGYSLRINRDNGGYFDYLEHAPSGGVSVDWNDRLQISASAGYVRRAYSNRTACEPEQDPPGSGRWVGADCSRVEPGEKKPLLDQVEWAWQVDFRASVNITSWLQAVVSYELEEAGTDVDDPMAPNHRVLAGVSLAL
jgi:hypothetical protein